MTLEDPAVLWINGKLLPVQEARISPFDQGFLTGQGVFETLLARQGIPLAVRRHWERLQKSCEMFQIPPPSQNVFRSALLEVLRASGLADARLRFTLSYGDVVSGPMMIASAIPLQPIPSQARAAIAPWTRNERGPLAGIKSLSYAENAIALRWAKEQGADEAVFANTRGELCEGCASNIFMVYRDRLLTPPLSSGCLPGVTRSVVLDLCRENGIPVEEAPLPIIQFQEADSAFFTSSIRGVQPISHVNGKPLSQSPASLGGQLGELLHNGWNRNPDP